MRSAALDYAEAAVDEVKGHLSIMRSVMDSLEKEINDEALFLYADYLAKQASMLRKAVEKLRMSAGLEVDSVDEKELLETIREVKDHLYYMEKAIQDIEQDGTKPDSLRMFESFLYSAQRLYLAAEKLYVVKTVLESERRKMQ